MSLTPPKAEPARHHTAPSLALGLAWPPTAPGNSFFVDIFSAKSAEVAGSCATAHRSDALHRGHVGGRVLVMRGSKAWSDGGEKLPWTERTEADTCVDI